MNLYFQYPKPEKTQIVISRGTETGISRFFMETEIDNDKYHCSLKWGDDLNADAVWWDALRVKSLDLELPKNVFNFLVDAEPYHLKKTMTDDNIEWKKFKRRFDAVVGFGKDDDIVWPFAESVIRTNELFHEAYPTNQKENVIVFMNSNCNTWGNVRENLVKRMKQDGRVAV